MKKPMSSWHVGVAAEAIAAGQFARLGYDVSVQYGANQPKYDLVVVKNEEVLKISVKGSQDGGWGLTQGFLKDANYHLAVDLWLNAQPRDVVFCFVQFEYAKLFDMPKIFLAGPQEVAGHLKATAKGRGDTILYMDKQWSDRAHAKGTIDKIPETWLFSMERIESFLRSSA